MSVSLSNASYPQFQFVMESAADALGDTPDIIQQRNATQFFESLALILPQNIRASYAQQLKQTPWYNQMRNTNKCREWLQTVFAQWNVDQTSNYQQVSQSIGTINNNDSTTKKQQYARFIPNLNGNTSGTPASYRVGHNRLHDRALNRLSQSASMYGGRASTIS
jgi:hypothetical protein